MRAITYNGKKIVESPYVFPQPAMQVSEDFRRLQSPELVESTNAWMRDFFGLKEVAIVVPGMVFISPRAFQQLETRLRRQARDFTLFSSV